MTELTKKEIIVLAACFARTNMGQPQPSREDVQLLLSEECKPSLSSAVEHICRQYIEDDEGYDTFLQEAKMWAGKHYFGGKYGTRESVISTWPDTKKLFWPD